MEMTRAEEKVYHIWINHKDKIVSCKSVEGFEQMEFSSYEERLPFALEKCSSGYRIQ